MTSPHLLTGLPELPRYPAEPQLLDQIGAALGFADLLQLRQVHALEHATIWVLTGSYPSPTALRAKGYSSVHADDGRFSGFSTPQGFYLTGDVTAPTLWRAAEVALQRLKAGEWNLAIHPRCGTNFSVSTAMMIGLSLMAFSLLPRRPLEQCLGIGAAAVATAAVAPTLGTLAQRHLTTALPTDLTIARVYPVYSDDDTGQPQKHFVQVR